MKINPVIAIVDTGGHLVYLERSDVVQWGSNDVAIHKAKASVQYKRPTLALENIVKSNITHLTLDGITAIEGGIPIISTECLQAASPRWQRRKGLEFAALFYCSARASSATLGSSKQLRRYGTGAVPSAYPCAMRARMINGSASRACRQS